MATKRRKVEAHRLTISGLEEGTRYGSFIRTLRNELPNLETAVYETATKSHALYDATVANRRLRLRFISYTTGYRPDVLDVNEYALSPNPLPEHQTGVEWTHCLGGRKGDQYVLLVEKVQAGIWPGTMERYLQWLIDEHAPEDEAEEDEPIVVSLEAVAGEAFLERLDHLTRIKKATVRVVRPNPGWADLENDLSAEADSSDAHKADVTMTARRRASLVADGGIIAAIRAKFRRRQLDYAQIVGEREGKEDVFDTKRLGEYRLVHLRVDEFGQVEHRDAWEKLAAYFDELE